MIALLGLVRHRPSGQLRRKSAAALVAVYALAVWALPFAHAIILDGASGPGAHVERQGTRDHREAHDALDCSVFAVARLLAAAPRPVPAPDAGRDVAEGRPLASERPRLAASRGAYSPRAPPLA